MELAFAAAHGRAGESIKVGGRMLRLDAVADAPLARARLIFSALPHGVSAEWEIVDGACRSLRTAFHFGVKGRQAKTVLVASPNDAKWVPEGREFFFAPPGQAGGAEAGEA